MAGKDAFAKVAETFSAFGSMRDTDIKVPADPIGMLSAEDRETLAEWRITIALQRDAKPGLSDRAYREYAYILAEEAIAVAKRDYILLDGPELQVTGRVFPGSRDVNHIEMIEAQLTLSFRFRRSHER